MNNDHNIIFIDAQNLHFGTTKCNICAGKINKTIQEMRLVDCVCDMAWKVDLSKFRIYLRENYQIEEAYYFLGNMHEENDELYTKRFKKLDL
jgi:hypothetical protein